MVALQNFLPEGDPARSDVAEVLKNNPDIRAMVEKIAGHAASYFGWMTVSLDTKRYDEWDPPLLMTITVPYIDQEEWARQYKEFKSWLVHQEDYDLNRLSVMVLSQKRRDAKE